MKKLALIFLLTVASVSAHASTVYTCEDGTEVSTWAAPSGLSKVTVNNDFYSYDAMNGFRAEHYNSDTTSNYMTVKYMGGGVIYVAGFAGSDSNPDRIDTMCRVK